MADFTIPLRTPTVNGISTTPHIFDVSQGDSDLLGRVDNRLRSVAVDILTKLNTPVNKQIAELIANISENKRKALLDLNVYSTLMSRRNISKTREPTSSAVEFLEIALPGRLSSHRLRVRGGVARIRTSVSVLICS